jgi:hypothetical protein
MMLYSFVLYLLLTFTGGGVAAGGHLNRLQHLPRPIAHPIVSVGQR